MNTEGGPDLIGLSVEQWVDGRWSRFRATGKIIDYRKKPKGRGAGNLTIMKSMYLIDFGNNKKYWRFRSDFTVLPA